MDLLLSPGYSLTLWSQPDTGFQHVIISTPVTLELPVSGYYGCRGRIPFHHLPQNVEPYLVKCRHLVVHPWVTVFVDGVEGQPTQCGTDQDQPESHQVDVEGPAPTHMETPCKNSISHKRPCQARKHPHLHQGDPQSVTACWQGSHHMSPSTSPGVRSHF